MARNYVHVIENRLLYSQNVFCYFSTTLVFTQSRIIFHFFSLVVRNYLEHCSEPRRNFYIVLCRKTWEGFCTLPHEIWLSIRTIFLTCDVRLLVWQVREPNQADHVIGQLVFVLWNHIFISQHQFVCNSQCKLIQEVRSGEWQFVRKHFEHAQYFICKAPQKLQKNPPRSCLLHFQLICFSHFF